MGEEYMAACFQGSSGGNHIIDNQYFLAIDVHGPAAQGELFYYVLESLVPAHTCLRTMATPSD